jgi:hypothetical protein
MKIVDKCYIDFSSNVQDKLNTDKEYKKAEIERKQAMKQIASTLTSKQLELLRKYDDSMTNVNAIVARKYYISGFNYGRKFK